MTHPKISVGILYGGKSVEHAVSVTSARTIALALERHQRSVPFALPTHQGRRALIEECKT